MSLTRALSGALMLLGLSGCLLGPDYKRPEIELPNGFNTGDVVTPALSSTAMGSVTVKQDWWTQFGDQTLNQLVDRARTENADLQIALGRLAQAEALARQAGAAQYPSLNMTGSGTRASTGTSVSPTGIGLQTNTSQLGLVTSYELDVWGRVRRNIESASSLATASAYDRDSIALTVSALVSNTYMRLRSLDAQIIVLSHSVQTRADTLRVARAKLAGGLVSPIDVNQALAARSASQATLSELKRQRAIAQNQLGVLTGKLDLRLESLDLRSLPTPPVPPTGLPSTILESRPDINRVEQELTAANARIGVATANFFPTLSLTGVLGSQSVDFSAFLSGRSTVWSASIGLLQPIFTGGALQARLDFANAQQQEVLGNYVKIIRVAFGEVSDALVSVSQTLETEQFLTEQVQAATKAQELAALRYEAGYVDYLNVLEAQRAANDANLAFVINRSLRLQAGVDLFKALGGGWAASP
jgi:multidrug efflux system outer membrane protein